MWEILLKIPYGKTTTYGQIAREIAAARGLAKMSAQAVGGVVGHNEISIIIPCHRVVGTHGSLTGYAGGIDRKSSCCSQGASICEDFFTPAKSTAAQSGKFKKPQKILMLARKSAIKFEYLNLDAAQRIACKSKASGDFKRLHRAQDGDH